MLLIDTFRTEKQRPTTQKAADTNQTCSERIDLIETSFVRQYLLFTAKIIQISGGSPAFKLSYVTKTE
jgi:hypothetical protein